MAHDINNPATYIVANLHSLKMDLARGRVHPADATELIDECLSGMKDITRMTRNMRRLARAEVKTNPEVVTLADIAHNARRISSARVRERAEVRVRVDAPELVVRGNSSRLAQIIMNLLINAADATEGQTDPPARVDVHVHRLNGQGCVDVRDNGPGIDPDLGERVFKPFVTSKPTDAGTGLGLAVSHISARDHGGKLSLMVHDGPGAWFRLVLPEWSGGPL